MAGGLFALGQLADGGGLGVDFGHGGVESVDAAVLLHQGHGGLFADACHAGDVVGGVAHEGLEVDHVDGVEAVLLPKRLRGHVLRGGLAHAGGHQLDLGAVGDELEGVLVAGDDGAVPVCRLAFAGDGADEVVRLPACQLVAGDVQRVQHFLHHRHLHPQFFRHGLSGGLVGGVGGMAEGGGVDVKGDADGVGPFLVFQAEQGGQKAENGVGIQTVPGA